MRRSTAVCRINKSENQNREAVMGARLLKKPIYHKSVPLLLLIICKYNRKELLMDEKFYTVPEVTELLKVSKNYIYELINRKQIDCLRLSERRIRIPASALENCKLQDLDAFDYNQIVRSPKAGRLKNVCKRAK